MYNLLASQTIPVEAELKFQAPAPTKRFWLRCQAKFLTPARFLTCYCLSVILLLRTKK